jgi:outer membrane protein assembly factor BamB
MEGRLSVLPLVRTLGALALLAALAACQRPDPPLPGERLPLRPVDPLTVAPAETPPLALAPARVNADWTHPRGDAGGRLDHPAFAAAPELRWSADIGRGAGARERLITAPVAAGGLVFTLDAAAGLTAVRAADGATVWRRSLAPEGERPEAGFGGGIAVAGGAAFVTTGFGEVLAVDAATGAVRWRHRLEAPARAAPTVLDGRVFAVGRNDVAEALDARTGALLWRVTGAGAPASLLGGASPAAEGPLVVLPFASGEVLGVVARSGTQAWGQAVTGGRRELVRNRINDVSGDPVIAGDAVYASNQSGRTIALDRLTGERRWTMPEGAYGPAWPAGGSLFLLSDVGALVRADAATGRILWSQQLPQYRDARRREEALTHHGPVLAGGRLWVASSDRLLRAFDPGTGGVVGSVALPGPAAAPPAVAGGAMFVTTTDGRLHAFQ